MTASPGADSFSFETSYDTSVVRPENEAHKRSGRGLRDEHYFVALLVFGVVFLFSPYTMALGASLLALAAFMWTMKRRSLRVRKRFERLEEPPALIRIRVTEGGYSIRGADFFAETSWNRVINGFEAGSYLLVQSWRMPRLYLPIDEMRSAGIYDRVRSIVEARSAERSAALAEARGARA